MTKRPSISGDDNHNGSHPTGKSNLQRCTSSFNAQTSQELVKLDHRYVTRTMIVCNYFHFFLLLLLTIASITLSSLEFEFPICSESHVKTEYTLQDPAPSKEYPPHLTKQCNVSIFEQEHYMYKIPAIVCQQITTTTTATYYFFGAKSHSSTTDYTVVPSLFECSLWNSQSWVSPQVRKSAIVD